MATKRQRKNIEFCEQVLYVSFEGDIENEDDVEEFLDAYLEEARQTHYEIKNEYVSLCMDLN